MKATISPNGTALKSMGKDEMKIEDLAIVSCKIAMAVCYTDGAKD